jgi:hypothetical protein
MHQNLLNAEFVFVLSLNAENINLHVIRIIQALTKVLLKCFCCTYACRQLHLSCFSERSPTGFACGNDNCGAIKVHVYLYCCSKYFSISSADKGLLK